MDKFLLIPQKNEKERYSKQDKHQNNSPPHQTKNITKIMSSKVLYYREKTTEFLFV
uniref:Uncharacterized protein n=1 Tax=Octopus bimaculoides TaxID=37653 RepID=A0A0L8I1T5_OCTBM